MSKEFKAASRMQWTSNLVQATDTQIIIGCLQRIADALERNNIIMRNEDELTLEKRKNTRLRKELKVLKNKEN